MKCFRLAIFLYCSSFTLAIAKAQSFTGYDVASYSGVYGTLYNPANILDHRVRADVNLAGFSFSEANNIVKLQFRNTDNGATLNFPTHKTGRAGFQTDILGPSFMVRLSDKHAFAISTRFRAQANVDKLSAPVLNLSLLKDVKSLNHLPITAPGGTIQAHAWNELAFTYSRQVAISDLGVWKAAISLKFTGGQGAAYFKANNLRFIYNDSLRTNQALREAYGGAANTSGNINLAYANFMDDWGDTHNYHFFRQPGIAADIGVTYEYRDVMQVYETAYNENTLNYKWKAGASVTDIGSIKYNASPNSASVRFAGQTYVFNDLAVPADSSSLQQIVRYYKTTFNGSNGAPYFTMALPTTLHVMFDYSFNKWFSTAAHFSMPLLGAAFPYYTGTHNLSMLTITPRAELPWVGAYLPISYHFAAGLQVGSAVRLGPLVIGSATAASSILLGKGKGVDAYFILRIPFFGYREYKEKDRAPVHNKWSKLARKIFGCPRL
ncbi:hypothetical protein FC093_05325 [Ilyomonas limi]|uniref:DUF5723 domain-containing protein n=1 Tax=Ilyomonas limi TaxID=2575867 RepID=A0A4U3L4Q5_9BACT|nr:DUF5723 family protein [Ilyomonas limi]TKK70171.1 hypothetical protein FC093_05325 [Ilyomonas limi]